MFTVKAPQPLALLLTKHTQNYTETRRQCQPSDLTATHCQSSKTITGAKHRARLAVSPALFDSSIKPDKCYLAIHPDYTPKLQCAQLHTRLATIYNYQRIQHSPHITIVGSTQDATRRKKTRRFPTLDTGWQPPHHYKNTPATRKYTANTHLEQHPPSHTSNSPPICFAPMIRTRHPEHRSTLHSTTISLIKKPN